MRQRIAKVIARMGFGNAIATIALFLALGGGSAVALSGNNTILSDDIGRGAVHGADIAKDAVTSPKVRDGSLGPADLRAVVAHVRGGPVSTGDPPGSPHTYPLSGAKWRQAAGEADQLANPRVTVQAPNTCGTGPGLSALAYVVLKLDGRQIASTLGIFSLVGAGNSNVLRFYFNDPYVMDAPAAKTHKLTATVSDECSVAGQNWTIKDLTVDVVGAR